MIGAQMAEVCHPPKLPQQAQALEHWADCRERAVARLELKVRQLEDQHSTDEVPACDPQPITCATRLSATGFTLLNCGKRRSDK
jgi:hypothetical protein